MPLYQGQNPSKLSARRRLPPPPSRRKLYQFAAGACILGLLVFIAYFLVLLVKLPKVDRLADYRPPIVSQVYGDNGVLVGEFYLERRTVVPVSRIPRRLIQAFVAAEDSNFYKHKGLDYLGILRAAIKNVISLRKKEGASTITQQVAKSMFLSPERKFTRKLKEAILAKRMEDRLTKDEILYIYLNQIYLGAGAYGVQVAAESYFAKDVDQLTLAEMAVLAGLPKAPNIYNPIKHLNKAKERQAYVLQRMVEEGYITQAEADHAKAAPLVIQARKQVNSEQSAYFLEQIRQHLEEKYGEERLYKEGLKIYTTMNGDMQKAAYEALIAGLKEVDKRQGFRGPRQHLAEKEVETFCRKIEDGIDSAALKVGQTYSGVVTGVNATSGDVSVRVGDRLGTMPRREYAWAGKLNLVAGYGKPSDPKVKGLTLGSVILVSVKTADVNKGNAVFALDQEPEAQAAVVAIDPRTGGVKAMVGGYDFKKSQFNRAVQAKRNPGSAFKPIIYGAALEKGLTPATVIDDSPVEYPGGDKAWKPKNYDNIYRGPVTMREALTNSINVVSVKILESIGVAPAVDFAKRLGITSTIEPNLSLALGTSSVSPLELTSAYAVIASGGFFIPPYYLTRVADNNNQTLEEVAPLPPSPVVAPEVAYVLTNLMQSVVSSGTGQRAKALGRPVAGKTGTTNDMKDAWFIGYVPQLVAGVWVGFDQERSLGAGGSGGQAAAPIWTAFMQKAVAGMPVENFVPPDKVSFALINPKTGRLVPDGTPGASLECFIRGTEPARYD